MTLMTLIPIFFTLLATSHLQRIEQDDAEAVLETATVLKNSIFTRSREESSNASCILGGLRDRRLNIFQFHKLLQGDTLRLLSERLCGSQEQWLTDLQYIAEDLKDGSLNELTHRQKTVVDATCGSFPTAVSVALLKGELAATKPIIANLLSQIRYSVNTPDITTLFENVAKIVDGPDVTVESFRVTTDDVVESMLLGVLAQNTLKPYENYQLLELLSALKNIRPVKNLNLLMLIKADSYPEDVIAARDKLNLGIQYGYVNGEPSAGWPTPPQQLLALLTSLTANPNDNEYSSYAHVLFSFYRHRYLSEMGYEFVPNSPADIAYLLNSFLLVRHPILLREVYLELTKIPWQTYVKEMDFSMYAEPRVLFLDMLKLIMEHPDALQLCNMLIFHYFMNAEECPGWLQILPDDDKPRQPIDVTPGIIPKPPPLTSKCPGQEIPVVDPDCLVEIIDDNNNYYYTNYIHDLIKFNPAPVNSYPFNTREAVLHALLNHFKDEQFKYDDTAKFIIIQAINNLLFNDLKLSPPVHINMCPDEISDLTSHEVEVPEIQTSTSGPWRGGTNSVDDDDSRQNTSSEDVTRTECPLVSIIDQQCLIDIISEKRTNAIKNIILMKPVLLKDYGHLQNRKEILQKVLLDRNEEIKDEVMSYVIPQAAERMNLSWEAALPPIIFDVCEGDLRYNIVVNDNDDEDCDEDVSVETTCANEKTIDPNCLIEILSDIKSTKVVQQLIAQEPILAKDFEDYNSRPEMLKAVVFKRCEERGEWQLMYDVKMILSTEPYNWRQVLPLEYLESCSGTTDAPQSQFTPSDVFTDIPGVDETPIPSAVTTEMPDAEDQNWREPTEGLIITETSTEVTPIDEPSRDINEEEECEDDVPSAAVGVGVAELGGNASNGQSLGDTLLGTILNAVKPQMPKKACKPKSLPYLRCQLDEIMTNVVKIESLWDALAPDSPRAPFIRSRVKAYVVPIDKTKDYTKAEILKDILQSVRSEIKEPKILQTLDFLIQCIRFEGPGMEPPEVETVCFQSHLLTTPSVDSIFPTCQQGEVLVSIVKPHSLYDAVLSTTPKMPYIWNRVGGYVIPIDNTKQYTKGEILRDILLNLKDEVADERVRHNIDILIGNIRYDGPGVEPPETVETCIPESSTPPDEELYPPSSEAPLASGAEPELPIEVTPTDPICAEMPLPLIAEETTPSSAVVAVETTPTVIQVEEATTSSSIEVEETTQDKPSSFVVEETTQDNSSSFVVEETTHPSLETTAATTVEETPQVPAARNGGESCPCPVDTALMKIIDNKSITNLLTDDNLSQKLNTLILPASKFSNKSRRETLEAALTELMMRDHEIFAATISCMDEGADRPTLVHRCVPTQYAYKSPPDVYVCPDPDYAQTTRAIENCPCPAGQEYMQLVNNTQIMDMLSPEDSHLRDRIASLVMPVAKYVNKDKLGVMQNVLREVMLREYENEPVLLRCSTNSHDPVQIVAGCVASEYADLFPMDVLGCPQETTVGPPSPTNCQVTTEVVVPSSLLEVVQPDALLEASAMVDIIMHSNLERGKYGLFNSRAEILRELLKEMGEVAATKLEKAVRENLRDAEKLRQWISQIDALACGIRDDGIGMEPPTFVNTCITQPFDLETLLCPKPTPENILEDAILQVIQNSATTPSPTGKRKIKKTHIVYTTKETINVNIQANKASSDTSVPDDISKIADIMTAEQQDPGSRIADQVGKAMDITDDLCIDITMHWPLLMKQMPDELCWDQDNGVHSHHIQIVNVTELLEGADGSGPQIYVASAMLAGLETFEKIQTFDMTERRNKADFLSALTDHLHVTLPVHQTSADSFTLHIVCNHDLYTTLPTLANRSKRHIKDPDALKKLNEAMRRGNELIVDRREILRQQN